MYIREYPNVYIYIYIYIYVTVCVSILQFIVQSLDRTSGRV